MMKKMTDLLPNIMSEIEKKNTDPREAIFLFWKELMGEKMAPMTEVISFKDGILTVKVKNSTLYSLLQQHEKPRLKARLQEKFSIRDIMFRVG